MAKTKLNRRHGIVAILDALGASVFSDDKIKNFLAAREELNEILQKNAAELNKICQLEKPNTYTFGDTLIVVQELSDNEDIGAHILAFCMLMQNYLYNSLEEGILFRGSFSIGSYIEDEKSNTVMGEAISDAASWYEKSDWMGLSSTPKTNNYLEYCFEDENLNDPKFLCAYPVPMKDGRKLDLYTISWAGRFFHDEEEVPNPKERFLGLLIDQAVPIGTESKYTNFKEYFSFIESKVKDN